IYEERAPSLPRTVFFLVHWALWYFPPSVTGHHCISGHRFPAIHRTGSARYHAEPTSILLSCGYSLLYVLSRCITTIYWRNIRDRWRNPALEVSYPRRPARSLGWGRSEKRRGRRYAAPPEQEILPWP